MVGGQCENRVEADAVDVPAKSVLMIPKFLTKLPSLDALPVSNDILHFKHVEIAFRHALTEMSG